MLTRFSWYLSCSNSDFDPWIVVRMRIWWSLQWHWSQPFLMTGSKLGFLGPAKVNFESTWSNLPKIFEKLEFDVKLWKLLFCESFDFIWPSVDLGLTTSVLVILAKKGTLSASVSEWVALRYSRCSRGPMKRKWCFLGFLESNMQIDSEQNIVSTTSYKLCFNSFVMNSN